MNIRLLKKIRKRYTFYWDNFHELHLCVIDNKKHSVSFYKGFNYFLLQYVYDHLGLWTGFKYQERLLKREKRSQYLQHLKQFTHQSPQTSQP
jgi:hypothetical protein